MPPADPKADLRRYLQEAREALLRKLDGITEYDARRPLTATGTNLLGLVKHVASVELGYFGETFERPHGVPLPWLDEGAEPNADMWATPEQSHAEIVALYHRAWAHSDATIDALDLDAVGHVPWWSPERNEVTLLRILAHMIAETSRHAGHADIVRELIDGQVGLRAANDNLPAGDAAWWADYRERLERAARAAGPVAPPGGAQAYSVVGVEGAVAFEGDASGGVPIALAQPDSPAKIVRSTPENL
ncbi:DinB family protein [Pengzhenrongella sicca]|uniref:DinB family protein n=1 Tax=Pengzhenrongella sicca TaxID=2819238 RepID=A0A8A4ZE58_9MICO|nr:DinB family protein [Pengzhenrongella sicca]QTE28836.1 DinB family protein [Pengzhenrongella sicca]